MPSVRFMAWNIQIFGPSKCMEDHGFFQLIEIIGQVMLRYDVAALAICEVRGNWGNQIGEMLKLYLNTTQNVQEGTWDSENSVAFIAGYDEEYLFVWDTRRLGLYGDAFMWEFHTAANPGVLIGFPGLQAANRAPFLACFQSVPTAPDPAVRLPCAMFHAPNPSEVADIRTAFRNMATARELLEPATECCIVMGDTNVSAVANSNVAGSNGATIFGPMRDAGFTQIIPGTPDGDTRTSLRVADAVIADAYDVYSQPYDTMLYRAPLGPLTPPLSTFATLNSRRCDLIADCMNENYLGPFLRQLHLARDPGTVPATATYTTAQAAFNPFRRFVSDHVPVITEVEWTFLPPPLVDDPVEPET